MAGLITPTLPQLAKWSGSEQHYMDTLFASGAAPQEAMSSTQELAFALKYYSTSVDETTVAGSRYFRSIVLGHQATLTGIAALIGGTGGTDKWLAELHDSAGNLLATSATAGATVGTANTWQQFAFTAAYLAAPGTYFIAIQSNGTTAKIAALNSPTSPLLVGSATGTFGTGAAITPPTTYTAGVGPVTLTY